MSMAVKASPTTGAPPSAATADMGPGTAGPQPSGATMGSRSIEALIAKFDEDSSSGLKQSEFNNMLGVLGTDPQVDTDGSGAIDQSELQKLVAGFDASVGGSADATGADGGGGGGGGSGGSGGAHGADGSGGAKGTDGSGGSHASSEPDDSSGSGGTPASNGAGSAGGGDLFTQADSSGDGEVTADELSAMAAPSASDGGGGAAAEPQRASRAASQRDRGASGGDMAPSAKPADNSSMFSQADADGSGEVTAQELGASGPDGDMMQSVFSHIDGFDSSGDGVIQSDEAAAAQGQQGSPQATPAMQGAE
jgi:EF hand